MLPAAGESLLYPKRASGFSSFSSVTALKCFVTSSMSFGSAAPVPPRQQPAILSFPRPSGEAIQSLRAGISTVSTAGVLSLCSSSLSVVFSLSADGPPSVAVSLTALSLVPAVVSTATPEGAPAWHPDNASANITGTVRHNLILLLSNTFMLSPSLKILCYTYYIIVQNGIEISKK